VCPCNAAQVWGDTSSAPDDTPHMRAANRTYGSLVTSAPLRPKFKQTAQQVVSERTQSGADASGHDQVRAATAAAAESPEENVDDLSSPAARALMADVVDDGTVETPVRRQQQQKQQQQEVCAAEAEGDSDTRRQCAAGTITGVVAAELATAATSDSSQPIATSDGNSSEAPQPPDGGTGIVDSLRSWFSARDEGTASSAGVMDASQLHIMHVGQAIRHALNVSGPLMTQHYQ
jgi:hypothetical protein